MGDVKERPIPFSGPMVQTILAGRKTQTRRVASAPPTGVWNVAKCPYGQPGERLWVRETWFCDDVFAGDHVRSCSGCVRCSHTDADRIAQWRKELYFRVDGEPSWESGDATPWKPSIHMPRWASRLTLEVTEVRVEQVQDISEEDAKAEGVNGPFDDLFTPRRRFKALWESIYGARPGCSWEANPFVWAISFRRLP